MIFQKSNFISTEMIDSVKKQIEPFKGNQNVAYNRDGDSVAISQIENLKNLDYELKDIFHDIYKQIVKPRFSPQFESGDTGYEYHCYSPGDICRLHSDGEVDIDSRLLRYATAIIFLTDNDGGELIFPNQNVEIKPEKGKCVVFPPYGNYVHYTKPSSTNREILMTWFVYNGINVLIK